MTFRQGGGSQTSAAVKNLRLYGVLPPTQPQELVPMPSHSHEWSDITIGDDQHFVSSVEKTMWNRAVDDIAQLGQSKFDSGWFTLSTSTTKQVHHGLGYTPMDIKLLFKHPTTGMHLAGNQMIYGTTGVFYGATHGATSTYVEVATGDGAVWHGVGNGNHFAAGQFRIIAS